MMFYFAYGSNMHLARLRGRAPSCVPVGRGVLGGHRLAFDKLGRDGSGKCNALRTGGAGDEVHGVVFEISEQDVASLDEAEGFGYDKAWSMVRCSDGRRQAMIYLAREGFVDRSLRPFPWYRELVLRGALAAGLPQAYVASIRAIATMPDPDPVRDREHRRILDRIV